MMTRIGTLNETSLHASLKQLYALPGNLVEAFVDGSIIDIVREEMLIEIQTSNFSALRTKLDRHIDQWHMRIIYPIALLRWVNRVNVEGQLVSRRKSPKRWRIEEMFNELIRISDYLDHPNFSLEVIFIEEEVIYCNDGKGSWRRKGWSVIDKRLIRVVGSKVFTDPRDYSALLPSSLDETFTSAELSMNTGIRKALSRKMLYCLRTMEVINVVGKRGNSYIYLKKTDL